MSTKKARVLTLRGSKWARGGKNGDSALLNENGCSCCLGIDALSRGVPPSALLERGEPEQMRSVEIPKDYASDWLVGGIGCNTQDAIDCMYINDAQSVAPLLPQPAERSGNPALPSRPMSLSGIPPAALRAALADPRNDGPAKQALERALSHSRASGPVGVGQGDSVPQRGREALGDGISTLTFSMKLPPKELSPNARVHWSKKAKAVAQYRSSATWAVWLALGARRPLWEKAEAQLTFYLPDNRRRDTDNLAASTKALWDGAVDAGLLSDDSGLTHLPPRLLVDRERTRVEITLTRIDS